MEIKDSSDFGNAISLVPKQSAWPKLFMNQMYGIKEDGDGGDDDDIILQLSGRIRVVSSLKAISLLDLLL